MPVLGSCSQSGVNKLAPESTNSLEMFDSFLHRSIAGIALPTLKADTFCQFYQTNDIISQDSPNLTFYCCSKKGLI